MWHPPRPTAPTLVIAVVLACVGPAPLLAHSGSAETPAAPPPEVRAEKVSDRVHVLFGKGGNVGVLVTDEGVVVVDDQYADMAPAIVDQVRRLTDRPIRWLINTHYHGDHTGGNAVLQKTATIVAHHTVRPRLLEYPGTIRKSFPARIQGIEAELARYTDAADPYRIALEKDLGLLKFFLESAGAFRPELAAPPVVTYDGGLQIWIGGQEVRLMHHGPGHTDGDTVVYFPRDKVVHMGDLFFHGMVPFIDAIGGGSARGYLDSLDRVLALLPPDVKVIPGHGAVTDLKALRRSRDFLADLQGEVGKAIAAGRSRIEAIRTIRMEPYPDIKPLFRSLGNDVAVIYDEMTAGR